MSGSYWRPWTVAIAATLVVAVDSSGADHGPVFGLATPTNPQGGWSFDIGVNGRGGAGGVSSTLEAQLAYGVTPNVKISVSGPVVLRADPYARSSVTTNTPASGDFSGLAWWRFQKQDFAGKRVESTALGGILVRGPQSEVGVYRGLDSGVGYLVGAVTGLASRCQYLWAGASYQRYAQSKGGRRPDLLTYTAVYGYRPFSWRTDYPRWDWRIFGEFTGERTGSLLRQGLELPGSRAQQLFLGPS